MEALAGPRTITLPAGVSARPEPLAALARRCYPDMAVTVNACDKGWAVTVAPLGELVRAADPDLGESLAEMGLSSADIMSWHRLTRIGPALWLEAMCRSWALLAFAHALTQTPARPLIIHVARHEDLATPTLARRDDALTAILEPQSVDVRDPASIRAAILRGLIGVDAYLTPLLATRPADIVHLAPAGGDLPAAPRRFDVRLAPDGAPSELLLAPAATGASSYRATADSLALAEGFTGGPVLLDIDLAFFDLLPRRRRGPPDTPASIDALIEGLRPLAGAITAVAIAYSPGACPSARWPHLGEALRPKLAALLGGTPPPAHARPTPKAFTLGTHRAKTPAETLARVAPQMERIGITRVADITGLDRIGIPVMAAYRPDALSVAVSLGKGATPEAARASAVMESIELWHAERPSLPRHAGTARELARTHTLADWSALPLAATAAFDAETPTLWVAARSLLSGATALVPYEAVHTDGSYPEPPGSGFFLCTSNGLASGNTLVEARTHALCELIERDAVTLWHHAGAPAATLIAPDTVTDPACRALLARFRDAGFGVVLFDATSEIGVPVAIAAVFDTHPDIGPQMGMGCHPSRAVALSRALTEAAQSRLTLISGARDDVFRDRYATAERTEGLLARFEHLAAAASRGRAFETMPDLATPTLEGDHDQILAALTRAHLEPYAVDLTRPDMKIPVVRAVVPGLEPPGEVAAYRPGRRALEHAP